MCKKISVWIPLIIAALSLLISVLSFCFTWYRYYEENKEMFQIIVKRVKLDYPTRIEQEGNGYYLLTYWECLLINKGKNNLTINNYELTTNDTVYGVYTRLNWCMLKNYVTQEQIHNPSGSFTRNIAPHSAETIYLGVGVRINNETYDFIKINNMDPNHLSLRKLEQLLENNMDIYGQPFKFKFSTTLNNADSSINVWKRYNAK